jgi:hypothetical protein
LSEIEKQEPGQLYSAGDAILYSIGERAYSGVVLSARYSRKGWLWKIGWEYIVLCGGLTYRVAEEDLWPHQYRHDVPNHLSEKNKVPKHKSASKTSHVLKSKQKLSHLSF